MSKLLAVAVVVCAVVGGFACGAFSVSAQSLGDVAKREDARRKTVKAPGKVYSNDSLRRDPSDSPKAATAAPAAAASPGPAQAQSGDKAPAKPASEPKKDEAYWKKRIQDERDALGRSQTLVEALQSRVNALANDFASRDDPAQRNGIAADRQKALAELERLKTEIQLHTKAIADIQEEARRAGVPAGWVR